MLIQMLDLGVVHAIFSDDIIYWHFSYSSRSQFAAFYCTYTFCTCSYYLHLFHSIVVLLSLLLSQMYFITLYYC